MRKPIDKFSTTSSESLKPANSFGQNSWMAQFRQEALSHMIKFGPVKAILTNLDQSNSK